MSGIDQLFQVSKTTDLGLIQDLSNHISKEKVRATLLQEVDQA